MTANTSHAIMAQRHEAPDSLDLFPTPPWAVRAFCEEVINCEGRTVWEPACGYGHMARPLGEYFETVFASDIHPYADGQPVGNFVARPGSIDAISPPFKPDWIVTNPPFNLACEFALTALERATEGVAMLCRSTWAESAKRYEALFRDTPPAVIAQYSERVPMVKGHYDPKASSATGYAWFVWYCRPTGPTQFMWIPPGQKARHMRDHDETERDRNLIER